MIGLSFLAIGVLWLAFSWYLATRLPKWLGIAEPMLRWVTRAVVMLLLLVGPFVDHIVGMQQFEKLCAEQTALRTFPNAASTKKGIEKSSVPELVEGYLIPIQRRTDTIVDADTGNVVASYSHLSTQGGRIGGGVRLGSPYECAVFQSNHPDHEKYRSVRKGIEISYGGIK